VNRLTVSKKLQTLATLWAGMRGFVAGAGFGKTVIGGTSVTRLRPVGLDEHFTLLRRGARSGVADDLESVWATGRVLRLVDAPEWN
jgi:hypothetical protein